jgi:hypothetical protein
MRVTKSVTAENQFSDTIELRGLFNISVSGTFVATIVVQRSFDGGSNWEDFKEYTTATEAVELAADAYPVNCQYRIGCKTSGFTSGTAVCILDQ